MQGECELPIRLSMRLLRRTRRLRVWRPERRLRLATADKPGAAVTVNAVGFRRRYRSKAEVIAELSRT